MNHGAKRETNLAFLRPFLWRYRRGFLLGFGALFVKDLLAAALPLAMRAAIDRLTTGYALASVMAVCGLMILLSALKGLFQYWMRVILIGISRDVEYDLRNVLFGSLIHLDQDFYARMRTGDILARATNDMNAVRMMLGPGVMYCFETSITLTLSVGVMLAVDWRLTLAALIPAPLITLLEMNFGRRIHTRFGVIQQMFSDISSRVQENLTGVRVVRAYVQERAEMDHFEHLNRGYVHHNLGLAKVSALFNALLSALIGFSFLLVLWMGGLQLAGHRITLGSFVMFYTYMGILVWPMIAMGWVVNLMQRGRASLARIREWIDERPKIAAPPSPRAFPDPVRGQIELRNVTVRYGDRAALDRVNLRIAAGETVAIVGHTGSGKSTLAHLIPRLIDPSSGAVAIDGIDLCEVSPEDVRRAIGYVPQETFLFSATLGENIAFGVKHATDAEILRAARIAGLGPDLDGFTDGLSTIVGERGITLSGGQKQRTAIARAVLRDPPILILDDALSSVDTATEERILAELAQVMRGRTSILISHRVSTIRHADRIIVLEHGQVVAEGSHATLLAQGGYYADLYEKQLLEEELEAI
jgi:ATP-binding cassette, subfamily B, multidrug efflux pump